MVGNMLGIKPVLLLDDGEIKKEEMTRKARAVIQQKIEECAKTKPASEYDYAIVSFGGDEYLVNYLVEFATKVIGEEPITGAIPINVSAHAGPGTVGVCVSKKINGKSIKEFM